MEHPIQYLLSIKQRLTGAQYVDENSVHTFRLLLLDTATFLTRKYYSYLFLKKDALKTNRLLDIFQNVKEYYHILSHVSVRDAHCYQQIWSLFKKDVETLESIFKSNIYSLQSTMPLGMAR